MESFVDVIDGPGSRPFVIAEVNTSHRGNLASAKESILAAKAAGADAVKFQSWSPGSLFTARYLSEHSLERRFYEKFSLTEEALAELFEFARAQGILASSTAYSAPEIDFLKSTGSAPFIKLASMDLTNCDLIRYALETKKTIIISTGLATGDEVTKSIEKLSEVIDQNLIIFHCTSIYPTTLSGSAVGNIPWLQDRFPRIPIGYSDHTRGSAAALLALALGARIFEKHFSLDTSKPGFDNQMAADFPTFSAYVQDLRDAAQSIGARSRELSNEEVQQREIMRRSAFAAHDLPAGKEILAEDFIFRRPGTGLGHFEAENFIGRVTARFIERDSMISDDMF